MMCQCDLPVVRSDNNKQTEMDKFQVRIYSTSYDTIKKWIIGEDVIDPRLQFIIQKSFSLNVIHVQ